MRFCVIMLFVLCFSLCPVVASTRPLGLARLSHDIHHRMVAEAIPVVRRIIKNYQLTRSLHFEALIDGWIGSPKVKLAKRYVFWGAGLRFRINYSVVSPVRLRISNCEVAFDGKRFQDLNELGHRLLITKRPPALSQVSLPVNPALEPASFLAPFWPIAIKVRGHGLSYSRLQQPGDSLISGFWRRFASGGRFSLGHGATASILTIPAGTSGEFSYFYRSVPHGKQTLAAASALFFPAAAPGGKGFSYVVALSRRLRYMPRKIQVIDRPGKAVETMEFHYREFNVGHSHVYLPSRIQKNVWGLGHQPKLKETIRLRHIVVDGPLPPNIFAIDFHLANIVIDGDTGKVLPVYPEPPAR